MSDFQIAKQVDKLDISVIAKEYMTKYAVKLILDRALPDARDGLKPVQRRMLYTMHEEKLTPTAKFIKASTIAGLNMAYYHAHGQADGVIVDLSEPWDKRVPLTEIHGNGGSIDGSPAAAGRYISARLTESGMLFLDGLKKDAVKMVDAYHEGKIEPVTLPAAFPAALVNGSSGIALGFKTDILPHNPIELLEAAKFIAENENFTVEDIANIVKGPDFPTGGIMIAPQANVLDDLTNGNTSFILRGECEIVEDKEEPKLVIHSAPWKTPSDKLIEQIAKVAENTKIVVVESILNDVESHTHYKISIVMKKGTTAEKIKQFESLLYKKTDLQKKFRSCNLMIADGQPKVLGVIEHLQLFLRYRKETLRNIWKFELNEALTRLEIVEAQKRLAEGDAKPVLETIGNLKEGGRQNVINALIERHSFTEAQANYIADMSVYRLKESAAKIDSILKEHASLNATINERELWLADTSNTQLIKDIERSLEIVKDMKRATKVVTNVEEVKIEKVEEVVESKPVAVLIKRDLQACYLGARAFSNQKEAIDKDENIVSTLECNTDDYIVILTKKGRAITRRVIDLDQGTPQSTHEKFNRLIPTVSADDELIGAVVASRNENNLRLVSISARGYAKLIDPTTLMLNVNNRGYLKRSGQFSSVKNGEDSIIAVLTIPFDELASTELDFELTHHAKPDRTVHVVLELEKLAYRSDKGGGNGARFLNTRDGARQFVKMEVKHVDSQSKEA